MMKSRSHGEPAETLEGAPARATAAAAAGCERGSLRSAMTEAPKRMGPLIRNLRRNTDPLFRRAGISLDGW
jgi:hypothetical protein